MEAFIFIILIVAIVTGVRLYGRWIKREICPRLIQTSVDWARIQAAFERSVTGPAWKVILKEDSVVVAEGGLSDWLTVIPFIGHVIGGKQSIALRLLEPEEPSVDKITVAVGAVQFYKGWFMPNKGHTLRIRIDKFERALRQQDPRIVVERHIDALSVLDEKY